MIISRLKLGFSFVLFSLLLLLLLGGISESAAQTSAFSYQGRLSDRTNLSTNGTYDFQFALYDASGEPQPAPVPVIETRTGVSLTDGIFTVRLDFGAAAFDGAERFLEIRVKRPADADYTVLSPRQQISASPYAVRTLSAAAADNALKLGGISADQFVLTTDARLRPLRFYRVTQSLSISASGVLRIEVLCETGDTVTGGGYFLNGGGLSDAQREVEVFANAPISSGDLEGKGWDIGIKNKTTTPRSGFAHVVCLDLTP